MVRASTDDNISISRFPVNFEIVLTIMNRDLEIEETDTLTAYFKGKFNTGIQTINKHKKILKLIGSSLPQADNIINVSIPVFNVLYGVVIRIEYRFLKFVHKYMCHQGSNG